MDSRWTNQRGNRMDPYFARQTWQTWGLEAAAAHLGHLGCSWSSSPWCCICPLWACLWACPPPRAFSGSLLLSIFPRDSRDWRRILIICVTLLCGKFAPQAVGNRNMKESNYLLSIVPSGPDDSRAARVRMAPWSSVCARISSTMSESIVRI